MKKESIQVALAYVGVLVGAGLSSGQDLLQYFLSFGFPGLIGVIALGVLNIIFGKILLTLGCYYQSKNHQEVLKKISSPIVNKIIDLTLIIASFVIGFVMVAGAGANLEQQFAIPAWAGSALCSILILLTAFLDFDKITKVLGIFTPVMIVLLALIMIYIAFRFKNIGGLAGGAMAVLALVNDVMVIFGTFVLLRAPLDGNFIAALLTILGYSVNDTVVIYDRIRENRKLLGKKVGFAELVNQSLNQSLKRTLMTSVTTVAALAVMCVVSVLYGLESIFTFAFPLMMGMISGVYTSLCISTSAWVLWNGRKAKQKK